MNGVALDLERWRTERLISAVPVAPRIVRSSRCGIRIGVGVVELVGGVCRRAGVRLGAGAGWRSSRSVINSRRARSGLATGPSSPGNDNNSGTFGVCNFLSLWGIFTSCSGMSPRPKVVGTNRPPTTTEIREAIAPAVRNSLLSRSSLSNSRCNCRSPLRSSNLSASITIGWPKRSPPT